VSSWGKWDQLCSNTCGNSLRTRQRTVLKQPLGFGRACPSLVDKQLCHEPACMSFTWRLGIWNTCQLTSQASVCGSGTQTREVACLPDPAREWICAKQAPKPAVVQKCSLSCPGTVCPQTDPSTVMDRFTGGGLGGVKPLLESLTPLIKCSTPPKFCFTPPILCERLQPKRLTPAVAHRVVSLAPHQKFFYPSF
jgi:hypothetical protein